MEFDDGDIQDDERFMRRWRGFNCGNPDMEDYLEYLEETDGDLSDQEGGTDDSECGVQSPPCPKCGSQMVQRKGPYGRFWGCTQFPECRGTINCEAPPFEAPPSAGSNNPELLARNRKMGIHKAERIVKQGKRVWCKDCQDFADKAGELLCRHRVLSPVEIENCHKWPEEVQIALKKVKRRKQRDLPS